jgi:hypothetical protein
MDIHTNILIIIVHAAPCVIWIFIPISSSSSFMPHLV